MVHGILKRKAKGTVVTYQVMNELTVLCFSLLFPKAHNVKLKASFN
jgi:hypothetical protein